MYRFCCRLRKRVIALVVAAIVLFIGVFGVFGVKAFAHVGFNEAYKLDNSGDSSTSVNSFLGGLVDNTSSYKAFVYDNANGLATSEVSDIDQTSDGAIWIGSHTGLIRYDGTTFERIADIPSVNNVADLFVDRYDRLWVGTNDNGVTLIDKDKIYAFGVDEGLPSQSVRSITEDYFGNVYIGTTQGIATIDREMKVTVLDDSRVANIYVRQLCKGKNGYVYGISANSELFVIRNGQLRTFYKSSDLMLGDIRAILPDSENAGYVYMACEKSEIYYGIPGDKISNLKKFDSLPLTYVNEMKYINNSIWICSDDGVGVLDGNKVKLVTGLPVDKSISHMMSDYQGNLWLSSTKQGLVKVVPCWFENLFEKYQMNGEVINSTCLHQDMLFIGKELGLTVMSIYGQIEKVLPLESASFISGKTIEKDDLIEMLNGEKIHSIIKDSKDNFWISTYGSYGLIKYDGTNAVCYSKADGMPSDHIKVIYECEDGRILAACTGGLAVIEDDKIVKIYGEQNGIKNTEILTVTEGYNNDIILGTDGGGIYIVQDSQIINLNTNNGLSSGVVSRIKNDEKRGIYWIITSNSISYMDGEYNITNVTHFAHKNNYDLVEDANENMWILSDNGIYIIPVKSLIENKKTVPTYYNLDNGLDSITTANSYNELTKWGDLYISGNKGVTKVNINNSFKNVVDINIGIPYVKADEQIIYPRSNGTFVIPSNTKKLTIYAYVYNYALVNPEVKYLLKGFDETEIITDTHSLVPVDYTNLPGGEYHFAISISDKTSKYSNSISVKIIKPEAFYEKPWFYIISIALVLGLIIFISISMIRYNTRKYEKKAKEQQTLIREISEALAKTIDMKDKYTNGHSFRVASYTAMLTKELGYNDDVVEKYRNIALLHDIGKIGIPEDILNKASKLTEDEFEAIKSHTTLGSNVLKNISIMPEFSTGAGCHHERPDGKGYPKGLKGDEIPRVAQIIAVADTFDAMYSNRTYRRRMNFDKVVSIIKKGRGKQLSADVVDAFVKLVERGEFRAPDDDGGGSMEDINNISEK